MDLSQDLLPTSQPRDQQHAETAIGYHWVDVLFALFNERRQRAFELLSKTRVVVPPSE
jgi:hypothetical protein